MGLPQLESCCFVFDLKTGNIILGCLSAFFSFVLAVVLIIVAASIGTVETDLPASHNIEIVEAEAEITGLYAMSIILVLMFITKFLFDILFVYGVVTERPGIIKAYFIMWVIFFLLSIFTFFLNAQKYSAGTICTELFYIGINVYAVLLSHSFYRQLNMREEV